MENYVNQSPQTLVHNSRETEGRNDQLTQQLLCKDRKYTTHLNNHTNYENITIQSLLDFNIVHFGKSRNSVSAEKLVETGYQDMYKYTYNKFIHEKVDLEVNPIFRSPYFLKILQNSINL